MSASLPLPQPQEGLPASVEQALQRLIDEGIDEHWITLMDGQETIQALEDAIQQALDEARHPVAPSSPPAERRAPSLLSMLASIEREALAIDAALEPQEGGDGPIRSRLAGLAAFAGETRRAAALAPPAPRGQQETGLALMERAEEVFREAGLAADKAFMAYNGEQGVLGQNVAAFNAEIMVLQRALVSALSGPAPRLVTAEMVMDAHNKALAEWHSRYEALWKLYDLMASELNAKLSLPQHQESAK